MDGRSEVGEGGRSEGPGSVPVLVVDAVAMSEREIRRGSAGVGWEKGDRERGGGTDRSKM